MLFYYDFHVIQRCDVVANDTLIGCMNDAFGDGWVRCGVETLAIDDALSNDPFVQVFDDMDAERLVLGLIQVVDTFNFYSRHHPLGQVVAGHW